ncbi:hypothetical protein [Thalassotalea euphylliae]|uniref:Uncharacterized protein n=1 Tax=Thalassotalea euphylliae TaxID=1655234 RepID=A0A3E0U2X5_9GAMM|nr:hypothetical protein [Thalassotalea euphylliae]REL31074.1 hypothetical protein DXX94_10305 [Thalassotalea euphylliae]
MAVNIDESLEARHVCIAADTGGGKTAAVKLVNGLDDLANSFIGDHVAIFDIYGNYRFDGRKAKNNKFNGLGGRKVFTYNDRASFAKALLSAWRSGKCFVVAYTPVPKSKRPLSQDQMAEFRRKELEWFGQLMWDAADGKRELYVVIEELAKLVKSVGKDNSIIGELATGGRAYGVILVTVFQRSQEVPKSIWNMSKRKIIGALDTMPDIEAMSKSTGAPVDCLVQVSKLNAKYTKRYLHYVIRKPGFGNLSAKRVSLKPPFKVDNWTLDELLAAE